MALEASQSQWKEERTAIVERMLAGGGKPGVVDPTQLAGHGGLERRNVVILAAIRLRELERGEEAVRLADQQSVTNH